MDLMTRAHTLIAGIVMTAATTAPAAMAQTAPYPLRGQPNVTTGDIHRYEMDRLRAQADSNQALAQSQAAQSRAMILDLQARRQPPLVQPPLTATEPLRAPNPEAARRAQAATEARSRSATQSTDQIDAWLDHRPQ